MKILDQLVAHRSGTFLVLATAAFFEAFGDSLFQTGLYRASGAARILSFAGGVSVLALYGLVVNLPRWDFGRLLGVYVVLFFVMAQILGKVPNSISHLHCRFFWEDRLSSSADW